MPDSYETFLKLLAALPLVVLLAYLLIKFGLRALVPGMGRGSLVVLQKVVLDSRSAVYLLKVGAGALLVGVAPGGISLLKELDAAQLEELLQADAERTPGVDFAAVFKKITGGNRQP